MAGRVEREIEEILARLEDGPEKKPISIADRREQRKPAPKPPRPPRSQRSLPRLSPATFLLAGAAAVIIGLLLSSFAGPLIWISFAGVVVFLGAFVASFMQSGRPSRPSPPAGHYWRDRYIEYEPAAPSAWEKVKRRFRGR